jgi:HAD superfamily hydrolase (TIGR01450 family)
MGYAMIRTDILQPDQASASPIFRSAVGEPHTASQFDRRALLVDWDGAVMVSKQFHDGALPFLQRHADRIAIVSNNSTCLPEEFSAMLARRGVCIPPRRIVLAGVEAIGIAASRNPRRAMVLGSRKMMEHALKRGLAVARTEPDAIVLLRDTQFSYRRLERAANGLRSGASLIVANQDATHPSRDDNVAPETGALLAALLACAQGVAVKKEIIGKPGPHLYWRALEALDARIEDAVMIGDNPDTDIAGARALGMEAILVDAQGGIGALART